MTIRWALCAMVFAVTACGGDEDCKDACDVVNACGLKTSGLSCDSSCDQGDCAACVSDSSCADIEAGNCTADCPGVKFDKVK